MIIRNLIECVRGTHLSGKRSITDVAFEWMFFGMTMNVRFKRISVGRMRACNEVNIRIHEILCILDMKTEFIECTNSN